MSSAMPFDQDLLGQATLKAAAKGIAAQ